MVDSKKLANFHREIKIDMKKRVIVIGGGASGMMAAGTAAQQGFSVALIEKNKILGKKLMITGKGRCNITNACDDVDTLLKNVVTNSRFLYSAFYGFDNHQTISFFEKLGVKTKIERGERVFPVSDKSIDVVNGLRNFLLQNNVEIISDTVTKIHKNDGSISGLETEKRGFMSADAVIIATGGASYPMTGSTGDGYSWAEELGHTVTKLRPSLVPITVSESWIQELQGLSLKNVAIKVKDSKGKLVYSDFGEMMFAHFGLTGPIILSASAYMNNMDRENYKIYLDLKPALDDKQLDARILKDFSKNMNKDFINSLDALLPKALIPVIVELSGINPHQKVNSITSSLRKGFTELLKNIEFNVTGFCPIEQAIITSGGISVKEINPSTMESKLVSGLYFAGEIIDVDALTGGFNLQIAFSTGRLAGLIG